MKSCVAPNFAKYQLIFKTDLVNRKV